MQHTVAGGLPFALLGVATFPSKHGARREERLLHGSCVRHGPARSIGFAGGANGEGKLQLIPRKGGEGEKESGAVPRALQTNLAAASQMKEQRPARGLLFLGINQELLKPNQGHPAGTGKRRITPSWSRTTALGPRTHCPGPQREQLTRVAVWPWSWGRCKPPVLDASPVRVLGAFELQPPMGGTSSLCFILPASTKPLGHPASCTGAQEGKKGGFPERRRAVTKTAAR